MLSASKTQTIEYAPVIFSSDAGEMQSLKALIQTKRPEIVDTIESQLAELVKMQHPNRVMQSEEALLAARVRLGEQPENYGIWVYYPWKNTLVHLLDQEEFIQVRTNRNLYKITLEEQRLLARRKVGIIGLSVGSGVAIAMAMERIGGELRIADFDNLELSNMNRIRTSLTNLALPKAVIVAREIAEIDPFLKVTLFDQGINASNIDAFFDDGGRLDLLVEECDSLPIKILARLKARERATPVIMETSDRGMIDVERFDMYPNAPILHGRLSDEDCKNLVETGTWTSETTAKIMSPKETSERMMRSVGELGKTITRWPQLASEVTAGAGIIAQLSRKILLGDHLISGRKFLDPYELFVD
jgi:molybdopterin/thiamine biosynthesis adenylyltransferase